MLKMIKMKNKAQATSLSQILIGLVTIGLIGMLIFFFLGRGQTINVKVQENEILRRKIILTNVLLSSEKLTFIDDSKIHRGVLDRNKIDNVKIDPNPLFSEISYPDQKYQIKIVDLENNNEWIIGKNFRPGFKSPIAIRYSEDNIHVGYLTVDFT